MKKHILLSVFLGCLITTYMFPQSENSQSKRDEAETEVTIEKIVVDEDGNETKYIITKKGGNIISDETVAEEIRIQIEDSEENQNRLKKYMFLRGSKNGSKNRQDANVCKRTEQMQRYDKPTKPRIGVYLDHHEQGLQITDIIPGSGAEEADLRTGDIIIRAEGSKMTQMSDLHDVLHDMQLDDKLSVDILRDGKAKKKTVDLGRSLGGISESILEKPCLGGLFHDADAVNVVEVFNGSGAEKAGLQSGDQILSIDGDIITDFPMFLDNILSRNPGDEIEIELSRADEKQTVSATIGIWKAKKKCVLPYSDRIDGPDHGFSDPEWNNDQLKVYPIPAVDQINLTFNPVPGIPVSISMTDASGKVILSEDIQDFDGQIRRTFSIGQTAAGMALIRIQQGDKVLSRQFLIQ